MKRIFLLIAICSLTIGCNTGTPEEKIANLNGYWTIDLAERPSGDAKKYKFSPVVDYIQVSNGEGIRKKVRPQLDGSYVTTNDEERFTVKVENDSINLYYETPFNSWKETLISSEEDEIEIQNQYGIRYTYKRFTPYLSDYGKEEE